MEYLQIKNGAAIQVNTHGNVEWDDTHYCPASKLTLDEAVLFNVHPLAVTEAPMYDPITQSVARDGCEFIEGQWQYKWRIDALSAEQISANQAASETARVAALWQAADNYEKTQISGSATALLVIGVIQGLPVSIAIKSWIKTIWTEYYIRKATNSTDTDYSFAGPIPHTVPELMAELGE